MYPLAWCLVFMVHPLILPLANVADDHKDGNVGHGYTRKAGHNYFNGQRIDQAGRHDLDRFAKAVGRPLTLCKEVDAATFVALSEEYSKDKNKVYYKWISPGRFWVVVLAEADPATFAVLDSSLAKDTKHVWIEDQIFKGADPVSAEVVNPHWAWKDRHRVYYQGTVLAGADPATFKHIGQGFYRDAKQVWWCTDQLVSADPGTFKTYSDDLPFGSDRNHVWSGKDILKDIDTQSFAVVDSYVFKDAKRVYVGAHPTEVLRSDAASFIKVARLGTGPYVLFKDRFRYYLFEPSYSEVFALEPKGNALHIWKPVWLSRGRGGKAVHGATVSAQLKDGVLTELELKMEPGFKDETPPDWEKQKLKQLKLAFSEAQKQLAK